VHIRNAKSYSVSIYMARNKFTRAAILGHLKYEGPQHYWALQLGQAVETVLYRWDRKDIAMTNKQADKVDGLLKDHDVPFQGILELLRSNEYKAKDTFRRLMRDVSNQKGDSVCAIMTIGFCAALSRQRLDGRSAPRTTEIPLYLKDLNDRHPKLEIAHEQLAQILIQESPEDLDDYRLDLLLKELSKPLRVLILASGPREMGRLRLDIERRELQEGVDRDTFNGAVHVSDVPACRIRDIPQSTSPTLSTSAGMGMMWESSSKTMSVSEYPLISISSLACCNISPLSSW
jgi:hypothetical protein